VGTGDLGTEVPQRGPGAEPDMHTQSAVDKHIFVIHIRYTDSATPTLLLKKLFEFVQILRPTLAEVGWARATCPPVGHVPRVHPWLRQCKLGQPVRKVDFTALNRLTQLQRRTTDSIDQLNFRQLFWHNSTPTSNDRLDRFRGLL